MNSRKRIIAAWALAASAGVVFLAGCASERARAEEKETEVEREGTGGTPVPRARVEEETEAHHSESGATRGEATPVTLREVFPHVRLDAKAGVIELDATVSIDAHNLNHPDVYLETLVCIPNSKEYESLLVTPAKPSHVHAALLLMGLNPGRPGSWVWQGARVLGEPPVGPGVRVRFVRDGREVSPGDWVRDRNTGRRMIDTPGGDSFVFAGSVMAGLPGNERYKADVEGCLIGLTTFGSETIAWTRLFNPEAAAEEPRWVADPAMPEFAAPVIVRISRDEAAR